MLEQVLRLRCVLADLRRQSLERGEFLLAADEADEIHFDRLAIKIAREIEQKDFQKRRAFADGRTPPVIGDAIINALSHRDAYGIDAVPQPAAWLGYDIRRRETYGPSKLLALSDRADDHVRMSEQMARTRDIALLQRRARRRRGGRFD